MDGGGFRGPRVDVGVGGGNAQFNLGGRDRKDCRRRSV